MNVGTKEIERIKEMKKVLSKKAWGKIFQEIKKLKNTPAGKMLMFVVRIVIEIKDFL